MHDNGRSSLAASRQHMHEPKAVIAMSAYMTVWAGDLSHFQLRLNTYICPTGNADAAWADEEPSLLGDQPEEASANDVYEDPAMQV